MPKYQNAIKLDFMGSVLFMNGKATRKIAQIMKCALITEVAGLMFGTASQAEARPLKVFITRLHL